MPQTTPDPTQLQMRWDDTTTFPFIEDQNGGAFYGLGHTDKATFAAELNEFDRLTGTFDPYPAVATTAEDVHHVYARAVEVNGELRLEDFTDGPFDGATELTTVTR